ncbi:MAG: isochorismatase family protein [Deltaproteobacteria bacterium]|nr:isochorismatase family protein [Deltaproteobacteria bacterium]
MSSHTKKTNSLLEPEDCLIVIIDVQEKLVPVVAEKESMIKNITKLLKFAKILDLRVLFTEQEKLGPTIKEIKDIYEGTTISKIHFNCFFCPDFEMEVERSRKNTLILAGIESHICVLQTAIYAVDRFRVHVLQDAVSSRSLINRDIAIERMRQVGCIISTTEIFIFELLKKAGTEVFRNVLSFIK